MSAVLHLLFALFLILSSFKVKPTMPVEVEEGLLVNFGFDQTGEGLLEPAQVAAAVPPPPANGEAKENDAVLTQDIEEAPEVKKKEPTPEELKKREEARLAEVRRREEAEAEKKRVEQENAERLRCEEEQRRLNQIKDRTRNAFGNAGNTGESGTSQGVTGGQGNQGVETGTPGAPNYGLGGGTGNGPVSYRLGDRTSRSPLPVPEYNYQDEGIVVVEISVDRQGNVTASRPGARGTTTTETYFWNVAREAAKKAKFDKSDDAPLLQKGTITYIFKLK